MSKLKKIVPFLVMSALFAISLFAVLAFSGCQTTFARWRVPLDNTISQLTSQNPNFKIEVDVKATQISNDDGQVVEGGIVNSSFVFLNNLRFVSMAAPESFQDDEEEVFAMNLFIQANDYRINYWSYLGNDDGWQKSTHLTAEQSPNLFLLSSEAYINILIDSLNMMLAGRAVPQRISNNTYRAVVLNFMSAHDFYINIQNNRVANARINVQVVYNDNSYNYTYRYSMEFKITYGNQTISLPTEYQSGPQISAPQNLTIDDNLVLRWDAADEDVFRHYVVAKNDQGVVVDVFPSWSLSFNGAGQFGRLPSGNYTFFVVASNSINISEQSNSVSATIQSFDKFSAPTNLVIDDDNVLRWDAVPNASNYSIRVYYRDLFIGSLSTSGFNSEEFDLEWLIEEYGKVTQSGNRFSGQLTIYVIAIPGFGNNFLQSDYSAPIFIQIPASSS